NLQHSGSVGPNHRQRRVFSSTHVKLHRLHKPESCDVQRRDERTRACTLAFRVHASIVPDRVPALPVPDCPHDAQCIFQFARCRHGVRAQVQGRSTSDEGHRARGAAYPAAAPSGWRQAQGANVVREHRETLSLMAVCALAAAFRFIGLSWGAPYFHFHIDEHFVFQGADMLRRSMSEAALSGKFFMYGPLTMWTLDAVRAVYEQIASPLVLTSNADEITYMVMGRAISATLGTATVPLVYLVARRVAGQTAALLSAFLLACAVVHLRESHFFSVDVTMLFFSVLVWLFAMRIAETGR